MNLIISPEAENDLDKILLYINIDNDIAAVNVVTSILKYIDQL